MTVALSILFAALVGGVAFMLLERSQRGRVERAAPVEPTAPIWTPERESYSSWQRPSAEAHTRPLPPVPEPRRESPPLWTPPPTGRTGHWDEDDRYRDEDDENRPPGLWSGWANR